MWLKQSTTTTVKLGPFVDETDGKTAETGLTISRADVRLSKNGGDMAQKNDSTACTHDEIGYYDCVLNATDTGTLGRLGVMVHEAGALPVWMDFMVVPANVFDSLFGSDRLQVHADEITAGLITATAMAESAREGIATTTLKMSWTGVTGEAEYSMLNAMRFLRNRWVVAGSDLTVYKENGSTVAWTRPVVTDVDAPPITGTGEP